MFLWFCVHDRLADGAIQSVGHATVQDYRSVLYVNTLSRTDTVLPSAQQTIMSKHAVTAVVRQTNASTAVLDVCRAPDLRRATASRAWSTRCTTTLHTEIKMDGYAATVLKMCSES